MSLSLGPNQSQLFVGHNLGPNDFKLCWYFWKGWEEYYDNKLTEDPEILCVWPSAFKWFDLKIGLNVGYQGWNSQNASHYT